MYYSSVPTLVIRADTPCLVSVNGRLAGECARDGYISLPICDTGDYYITVAPLYGRWPTLTRKLSFERGTLSGQLCEDVSVCVWPGGVFELTLFTGAYMEPDGQDAPYCAALSLACAFATAVRDGNEREAFACLEPSLASSVDFSGIREFFGTFCAVCPPVADATGKTLGFVSEQQLGVSEARVFEFEYENGLISNVKEA